MKESSGNLIIINAVLDTDIKEDDEWRDQEKNRIVNNALQISSAILRKNAKSFLAEFSAVIKDLETTASEFELEEIEISTAVTASGSFALVGFGSEFGGEGGIKFKFGKRR